MVVLILISIIVLLGSICIRVGWKLYIVKKINSELMENIKHLERQIK